MRLLHTSDWHIGRSLYGQHRYKEYVSFLDWLAVTIEDQQVDALLVSGDIFDTTTPSNRAQSLYYRFLSTIAASSCRHVIITAGNHDSPTFLDAPKDLLKGMHIHVIGTLPDDINQEVLVLHDKKGKAEAIICAVPYLRDRDLRSVEAGESLEDKDAKLIHGIEQHYQIVAERAKVLQAEIGKVPIIAMGHLFTAGGISVTGDGVRELYVGSLAHVGSNLFPELFDYVALGHLHVPQIVGKEDRIRYSGSPIPMGFGEAGTQKQVVLVDFFEKKAQGHPKITTLSVPLFQDLKNISGTLEEILHQLSYLIEQKRDIWVEIEYTGSRLAGELQQSIEELVEGSTLKVLRIRNMRIVDRVITLSEDDQTLDDIDPLDLFDRCLDVHQVTEDERPELIDAYKQILQELEEHDELAE